MSKSVKLSDIGQKLGVSTVTVSKALSGQKGVSEEMREKIRALANEMGYQSPTEIKMATSSKSFNIGVLISDRYFDRSQCFYWLMYQDVATKAQSKGSFTMLEVLSPENEKNLSMPMLLTGKKVDGLIIIGMLKNEYMHRLAEYCKVPYICMDFYNREIECDAVINDNYYGMYNLVNYLFDKGHKKIAYVGTLLYTDSITDRFFGYNKAMLEHGVLVPREYIIDDRNMEDGILSASYPMQFPADMPTAFACNCDAAAVILTEKLMAMGYRVPEDISVVGFDNYIFQTSTPVEFTTYEVDVKEMARQTVNTLIKKMNGEKYHRGMIIVEGKIVIKDSVSDIS